MLRSHHARAPILRSLITLGALMAVSCSPPGSPSGSSDYLYLWASSADSSESDFLAVYDVRDRSSANRYGDLVATVPVPGRGNRKHHTEHFLAADRLLFANGYGTGRSFIFDLTSPSAPRLAKQFGDVSALMHPHSFWRLPNGNVLATFQMQHDSLGIAPGGLVELTRAHELVLYDPQGPDIHLPGDPVESGPIPPPRLADHLTFVLMGLAAAGVFWLGWWIDVPVLDWILMIIGGFFLSVIVFLLRILMSGPKDETG